MKSNHDKLGEYRAEMRRARKAARRGEYVDYETLNKKAGCVTPKTESEALLFVLNNEIEQQQMFLLSELSARLFRP